MLRDYQQKAIDMSFSYLASAEGDPCLELCTGAGKSHIVAGLCKLAVQQWPETRIVMLTHVKELIEQNAAKMREHWPNAPMGIISAGMRKKEYGEPITFAGIQSVAKKPKILGCVDLVIIDECHLVSHKDEGNYRKLINALREINPHLRVIGLTATPYRLGHGLITEGEGLFDELIKPVDIMELIARGFLSTLRSKDTSTHFDLTKVKKRGGEYIESDLQKAVDTDDYNRRIVAEVIARAEDRKHWLFFCTGIDHSEHVRDIVREYGITCETITGKTPKAEREKILEEYKSGKIQALTNANVLTTGFDFPGIDLIVMMRPTASPSLYVQMAGRGLRVKPHTDHCLVLDFAGNVSTHGPITHIEPPRKKGKGTGEPPARLCDNCGEICHISAKCCTNCLTPFPVVEKPAPYLRQDDIMAMKDQTMTVTSWRFEKAISHRTGKEMIKLRYYGELSDPVISEYFTIFHDGFAGDKGRRNLASLLGNMKATQLLDNFDNLEKLVDDFNQVPVTPKSIAYQKQGKFYKVTGRVFND